MNSSNFIAPNTYRYNLPQTAHFYDGDLIALASIDIYNSFFNISSSYNNNQYKIKWIDNTVYTLNLPDGYYSISDLNYNLVNFCILNNLYLINNSSGQPVLYYTFEANSIQYATTLTCYAVPTSAQAATLNYSKPSGATWAFPTSATTPQVYFMDNAFNELLGFNKSTYYPSTQQSTNYEVNSPNVPEISVVNSLLVTCNACSSQYAIPNNVLTSIPINTAYGNMISISTNPPLYSQSPISSYNFIELNFYDQNFRPVKINDKEATIVLSLLKK